ncbi:MAG TPA: tetratricopeptide repeat protein [Casimicrobiaceae bacterium]|nr:tetratricopeptide repeat protein [Casimicrobiaceae bacterium]
MKALALVVLVVALAGCASMPTQSPEPILHDALFGPPTQPVRADDVFAASPAMKAFVATDIERLVRIKGTRRGLFEALRDKAGLSLEYDSTLTRNAAEAFEARKGNCLSLVIMTAAFAKEMGLPVRFQNVFTDETWSRNGSFYLSIGHVNVVIGGTHVEPGYGHYDLDAMVVDFLPPVDARSLKTWIIDESTIVAMYMNNRAVEALIAGNVNDAYWWAREAVRQDAHFLGAANTLGVVYRAHGDLPEAQRALDYVLAREPDNASALSNLVTVLKQRGDTTGARVAAERLARIEPTPPFAYFERGIAAMKAGDYRLARDMFTREVDRAAYYHEFRFWLALANLGLGDMDQARANLAIALENSPAGREHDLYAAKLERLRAEVPVIRR